MSKALEAVERLLSPGVFVSKRQLKQILWSSAIALDTAEKLIAKKQETVDLQADIIRSWQRIATVREQHIKALERAHA